MRLLIVGVAMGLLSLTACSPFADAGLTPDGYPIHPRMVPPPPPSLAFADASCEIGLSDLSEATIERVADPQGGDGIEEWTWWFADDSLYQVPSLADCFTSWIQQRQQMQLWYSCAGDHKSNEYPFPYSDHNESIIQGFVLNWYCDSNHNQAYLPITQGL